MKLNLFKNAWHHSSLIFVQFLNEISFLEVQKINLTGDEEIEEFRGKLLMYLYHANENYKGTIKNVKIKTYEDL